MQSVPDTRRYLEMTAYHFNYTNFDGIDPNREIQFPIKKIKFPQMIYSEEKNNLDYIKYQMNTFTNNGYPSD